MLWSTEMALMDEVRLDSMVTVVDSSAFLDAYLTQEKIADRPDLGEYLCSP